MSQHRDMVSQDTFCICSKASRAFLSYCKQHSHVEQAFSRGYGDSCSVVLDHSNLDGDVFGGDQDVDVEVQW